MAGAKVPAFFVVAVWQIDVVQVVAVLWYNTIVRKVNKFELGFFTFLL